MNWLEIAKRIRQECRIAGTGPTAITNQTGEMLRVVDWMAAAYEDIQASQLRWKFLRKEFSFSTVAGTADYGPTQHLLTDVNDWDFDTFRCYSAIADEQFLEFMEWEPFRDTWKLGANRTNPGRPSYFSEKPNGDITFNTVPDAVYTVTGEYYQRPVAVGDTSDSPIFPEQYHMAIVYRAMMFYATHAAEPDKYLFGQDEYRRMMRRMTTTQLPGITFGGPLA